MKCPACNATIPSDSDICPACFAPVQTTQEPLAPPCTSAPVRHPREVENQSETSWKTREGQQCTPLRENTVRGNVEGRFSRTSSKKGLFIAAGVLVLLIIAGYVMNSRTATPVVAAPTVEEKPTSITDMPPAKTIEASAPEKPAEANPAPVQEKKTAKKTPKASAPKPAPAPERKAWTYRPDPVPAKPAPAPKTQKAGIAGWLDKALGPEKPVTPPASVNDARGTGM